MLKTTRVTLWLSPSRGCPLKNVTIELAVSRECADHDYEVFHVPRPNRSDGGVALLIKMDSMQ